MRTSKHTLVLIASALLLAACDEVREVGDSEGEVIEWPGEPSTPDDPAHEPDSESPADDAEACSPAPEAFAYSLCSCEGLTGLGNLSVRGDGVTEAFVGINGHSELAGAIEIDGSGIFYDGLTVAASLDAGGHVASAGRVAVFGEASIGGNLDVGDDLNGYGVIDVGGALRVDGVESVLGSLDIEARGPFQAPPQPCGCDEPLVDVAAEVTLASQSNHNAAIGLPQTLDELGGDTFSLPSGRYYLSDPRTLGASSFEIAGAVSLYVDGSLESLGHTDIELAEGATLDLYISGSLRSVGNLSIGDEAHASSVRIYVGGSDSVTVAAGNQTFYGSVYAPQAYLETYGNTTVVGGLFVRGLLGAGNLEVVGVAPRDFAKDDCPPPTDDCVADPDLGGCGTPPAHVPEG